MGVFSFDLGLQRMRCTKTTRQSVLVVHYSLSFTSYKAASGGVFFRCGTPKDAVYKDYKAKPLVRRSVHLRILQYLIDMKLFWLCRNSSTASFVDKCLLHHLYIKRATTHGVTKTIVAVMYNNTVQGHHRKTMRKQISCCTTFSYFNF